MIQSSRELQDIKDKFLTHEEKNIQIKVAMSSCSLAAGSREVFKYLKEEIYLREYLFELSEVGCMGLCHLEPTIEVSLPNNREVVLTEVDLDKAKKLLDDLVAEKNIKTDVVEDNLQLRLALRNTGKVDVGNIEEVIAKDGYNAIAKALDSMEPLEVVNEITFANLKGRGGVGFPTGIKWMQAYKTKSDIKYVICNCDEGDPAASMNRGLLEGDPHSVIEGMLLCGYGIGATEGFIYIRSEYRLAIEKVKLALALAREKGLLGSNILGSDFSFDIGIKYADGSYECGEETALINSITGRRGEPRIKPPYPPESGYHGKPTIVNNVETLAHVPNIIRLGSEWFKGIGTEDSSGTKVLSLGGHVKNKRLLEVPMGTSVHDVIYKLGGGIIGDNKLLAVQTGGPSGGFLSNKELDTLIEYSSFTNRGSSLGSGAMTIVDNSTCIIDFTKYFLDFSLDESCGKCVPCRIGIKRLHEMVEDLINGKGSEEKLIDIKRLASVIHKSAFCGLGKTAVVPLLSSLEKFPEEYKHHAIDKSCSTANCTPLLHFTITDACVGCHKCAEVCPYKGIMGRPNEKHFIDQDKCNKCGTCYEACEFAAIRKE